MQTLSNLDSLNNVVRDVHWKVTATKDGVKRDVDAFVRLSSPSANNFTDYNNLTQDQVVEWVKSVLDVQAIEAGLANQFYSGLEKPLPWAIPEDVEAPSLGAYFDSGKK